MKKILLVLLMAGIVSFGFGAKAIAQEIEKELVIITPLSKIIVDSLLNGFTEYAKEKWDIKIKTSYLIAGTPVAYGRIVEWKGKPGADLFWGGECTLHDDLADKGLAVKHGISEELLKKIPLAVGKPVPLRLKDPRGYWVCTSLDPYAAAYNAKLLKKLGIPKIETLEDLLNPKLKGHIVQCQPDKSSSNHSAYEVILQLYGWDKGWDFARKLAANTGFFTGRSRDVPAAVAKGEYAVGFGVVMYQAFDEKVAGFDVKFVPFPNCFVSVEPVTFLKGAKHPKVAEEFATFLLSDRGQKIFSEIGLFPIMKEYKVEGPPGSRADLFVEFTDGMRSFYEKPISNVYNTEIAKKRYHEVNRTFHKEILQKWAPPK